MWRDVLKLNPGWERRKHAAFPKDTGPIPEGVLTEQQSFFMREQYQMQEWLNASRSDEENELQELLTMIMKYGTERLRVLKVLGETGDHLLEKLGTIGDEESEEIVDVV